MDSAQISDRELLELAAKAAGLVTRRDWFDALLGVAVIADPADMAERWNPLESDAEAFRLAVKLRIDLQLFATVTESWRPVAYARAIVDRLGEAVDVQVDADPLAATRRAVVRAAAAIGAKP